MMRKRWTSTVRGAEAEVGGDDLARLAGDQAVEHGALAGGQAIVARPDAAALVAGARRRHAALDQVEQAPRLEGLLEKIDGARAHRLYRGAHLALGRHHDQRQVVAARRQLRLQVEAAEAGHAQVGEQTGRSFVAVGVEEGAGILVHLRPPSRPFEQKAHVLAQLAIVVDDVHDPLAIGGGEPVHGG